MNVKCRETSGDLTFVFVSAMVVEKSCFIDFFVFGHFPLLAEHTHFALDLLKAGNCPLYVKNEVDQK